MSGDVEFEKPIKEKLDKMINLLHNSNTLKCAFCDWRTRRFSTTKKGKRRNGYSRLVEHVMITHPKKYEDLQRKLQQEERE